MDVIGLIVEVTQEQEVYCTHTAASVYQPLDTLQPRYCVAVELKRASQVVMQHSLRDFSLKTFPKRASLSGVWSIRMQGLEQTHVGRRPGGPGALNTADS
ncbi:uncharacterized [Tachysurus ichikawai]